MAQKFQDDASATSVAFANAQNNLATGMATLAAQASITRAQNEIAAVRSAALSSVNLLA